MRRREIIDHSGESRCEILFGGYAELLHLEEPNVRTIAVIDSKLAPLMEDFGGTVEVIEVEGGEEHKTLEGASQLWQRLIALGADRHTRIVGIGGGTVTDLVGFVASTYMRGVEFSLVPTTLLGMVDAAIGGKCGINMAGYKNMVGTFALPRRVVCDISLLGTLPEREWRCGMAEVIKTAVIGDGALFELLENQTVATIRKDANRCLEVVARSVAVKCDIVRRDLCEAGERRLLNLGHTLGHAIESLSRDYSHGEAVAVGIAYATRMAVARGLLIEGDGARIVALLERYGLPTEVSLSEEDLMSATAHDKKRKDGAVHWVMPTSIGHCVVI